MTYIVRWIVTDSILGHGTAPIMAPSKAQKLYLQEFTWSLQLMASLHPATDRGDIFWTSIISRSLQLLWKFSLGKYLPLVWQRGLMITLCFSSRCHRSPNPRVRIHPPSPRPAYLLYNCVTVHYSALQCKFQYSPSWPASRQLPVTMMRTGGRLRCPHMLHLITRHRTHHCTIENGNFKLLWQLVSSSLISAKLW